MNLDIAVLLQLGADKILQPAVNGPAVVVPEYHSRSLFLDVEEIKLLAELSVVALCGLGEHVDVLVKLLLVRPCGSVDALQHLVLGIAAPVRAGGLGKLEMLAEPHVGHMRAAAHVDVLEVVIESRMIIPADVLLEDLHLVGFIAGLEDIVGLLPGNLFLYDVVFLGSELVHALLKVLQLLVGERVINVDIIIEAVLDHRADCHLGIGIKLLEGMPEQMGTGVADNLHAFLVLRGDDGEGCVALNRIAGIAQLSVHLSCNAGLCKPGADVPGNIHNSYDMIVITLTSVRKSNNRHFKSFNSGGTYQMPRALNLRFRAPLPFSGKGALSVDDKSTA